MFENNLPPLRFGGVGIGQHYLDYIDMSLFSNALVANTNGYNLWGDIGAQINFVFKDWFNLQSTFSAGIAKSWFKSGDSWQWFLSYKILKN
jgi:hypothetical protein